MAQSPVTTTTEVVPTRTTSGKEIGNTTRGAAGAAGIGAGAGYALGKIIVFILFQLGIDASPIEEAIIILCTALVSLGSGLVGGKFSPTDKANETVVTEIIRVQLPAPEVPATALVTPFGAPNYESLSAGTLEVNEDVTEAHSGSTARHRKD